MELSQYHIKPLTHNFKKSLNLLNVLRYIIVFFSYIYAILASMKQHLYYKESRIFQPTLRLISPEFSRDFNFQYLS